MGAQENETSLLSSISVGYRFAIWSTLYHCYTYAQATALGNVTTGQRVDSLKRVTLMFILVLTVYSNFVYGAGGTGLDKCLRGCMRTESLKRDCSRD